MWIVAPIPQQGGPKIPPKSDFFLNRKNCQKLKNFQKYTNISNIPFDQRSLIHQEAWFPPCFVGPRIPQNLFFLKNGKKSTKTQKFKNLQKHAKFSDTSFDQRFLIHWEAWFPTFCKAKSAKKNVFCFAILDHFETQMFKSETTSCHYFPQGFSKNIGHPFS